jgi:hypothetical protein
MYSVSDIMVTDQDSVSEVADPGSHPCTCFAIPNFYFFIYNSHFKGSMYVMTPSKTKKLPFREVVGETADTEAITSRS